MFPMGQVFTYPMEMYVVRHVVDVSVFQTFLGMGPISSARHYGITIVLWGLTIILATSTDNLGSILEIFGAFGASVSAESGEKTVVYVLWVCFFFLLQSVVPYPLFRRGRHASCPSPFVGTR